MAERVVPKVLAPDDLGMHLLASGVRATEIGEDGNVLLLGHHGDRRALGLFAEFSLYRDGYEMTEDDLSVYDVRRSHASFSDHSEGCERVNCECEQDDCCIECRYLNHDECDGQDCLCADDWDHDRPKEWPCSCECYCDEYGWWAAETKSGHEVTWVTYSWTKAKAKAQTTPFGEEGSDG